MNRFRLRILMQNVTGYFTLFIGIWFVMISLSFAVGLPATLKNYQDAAEDYMIAEHQYILKKSVDAEGNKITTDDKSAEEYSSRVLLTVDGVHVDEEVTAYGYTKNSRYLNLPYDVKKNEVWISKPFSDKFNLQEGQALTLKEHYTSDTYDFIIKGIYNQPGIIAIFMPNDILKLVRQLDHSMGGYMDYFSYACMGIAVLLILLLTKIIIEKNTVSISMLKVLGYNSGEINSVFIRLTTIMVVIAYLIVVLLDMRRIKRIPMTEALKSVE